MARRIYAQLKFRRKSETEWASTNLILALGEPGYDFTNHILKIGDGVNLWKDLPTLLNESSLEDLLPSNRFKLGDQWISGSVYLRYEDGNYIYNPDKPGDYEMYTNGNSIYIKSPPSSNVTDEVTGIVYSLSVRDGEVLLKKLD